MNRPADLRRALAGAGAQRSLLGFLNRNTAAALAGASRNIRGFTLAHQARFGFPFVNKVMVIAGAAGREGAADGRGATARFNYPRGIAVGPRGVVYVADTNNRTIRMISPSDDVTTIAGAARQRGATDGRSAAASFGSPVSIATGVDGTVYVADMMNHTIRMIRGGDVTTLAGEAGQTGAADGPARTARFNYPMGVAVSPDGTVYVSDSDNNTVRMIRAGFVTTLAGVAGVRGAEDGHGAAARFNGPRGIAVGADGTVYVADTDNNMVRMIRGGDVTTLAGVPWERGAADGDGEVARFNGPIGLAVGPDGAIYVGDSDNDAIRIIRGGNVTTLQGAEGVARFTSPHGVAVGPDGTVYVAETNKCTISKIQNPPPLRNFTRENAAAAAARGGKRKTIKKRKNTRKTRNK